MIEIYHVERVANGTRKRVLIATLRGAGNEGDDAHAVPDDRAEVVQPLGLYAVPEVTGETEAVAVRMGDQTLVLHMIDKSRAAQTCEAGGTKVYGAGGTSADAQVYIRSSGKIEITAHAGQDVVINGGSAAVGRVGDAVHGGTVTASNGGGPVQFVYTPYGGLPGAPAPTLTLSGGQITAGAPNVKA